MGFWDGKRVCITGGAGVLGSYVVRSFDCAQERERGCREVFVPRSKDYDLTQLPAVQKLYADSRSDIVIHPSTLLRAGSFGFPFDTLRALAQGRPGGAGGNPPLL